MLGTPDASYAQDDFMSVCMAQSTQKSCQCMQGQIPADKMASAVAALRKSNAAMAEGGKPLDPSSLPPDQMQGLQQYVLAQAACM
jgi:hypothetical protein